MSWYFTSSDNQATLKKELDEWLGTPFRHLAGVKQVGADCIHFTNAVYQAVGAIRLPVNIPHYDSDWCHHISKEIFYLALKARADIIEVPLKSVMNGDLVLYKFGRATSHCGIYFDRVVYQAVQLSGVQKVLYVDKRWHRRRRFNFRIKNV